MEHKTSAISASDKSHSTTSRSRSKMTRRAQKENSDNGHRTSKVNRILNNIERSIMRPFSTDRNSSHDSSATKTSASSSMKHVNKSKSGSSIETRDSSSNLNKHIQESQSRGGSASENRLDSKNGIKQTLVIRDNCASNEQQKLVSKDQVASTEFYQTCNTTSRSSMTVAKNSVGMNGNTNGKLELQSTTANTNLSTRTASTITQQTFNKFQQQLVSTLRNHSTHSHNNTKPLPTNGNKLSIPPPHANNEARSQSQSLLLCRDISDTSAVTSLTVNHQTCKSSVNANNNPPSTESFAKKNSATSRLTASSVKPNLDASQQRSSSPAASAKSMPSIVTRLGSQLHGGLKKKSLFTNNNQGDSNLINKAEDEESGFSNYQSRRQPLRSMVSNQPTTSTSSANNPPVEQTSLSTATNTTASNMIPIHHTYWQQSNLVAGYNNGNRSISYQPQHQRPQIVQHNMQQHYPIINSQIFQVSQPLIPSNQVPIVTPFTRKNLTPQLDQFELHKQQQAMNNYFNNMRHQQNPTYLGADQQLYGVHSAPQVKPYIPTGNANNSQQIYANAPPKPRRYQFYNTVMESPNHMSQVGRTGPIAAVQQHQQHATRPLDHISTRIDLANQSNANNTLTGINLNHDNISSMNSNQVTRNSHLSPNTYLEQAHRQQLLSQQLNFANKSKSSLDAGDLLRFRQNRPQRVTEIASQPQAWQPIYGSHLTSTNVDANHLHNLSSIVNSTQQLTASSGSSLQRSKSVTHLLPDYGYQAQISGRAKEMWHDSRQVVNNLKYLSTSSASTTNLNNATDMNYNSDYNVSYVLNNDRNSLNRTLSSYHLDDPRQFYDSSNAQHYQQYSERLFPNATLRRPATKSWLLGQHNHHQQHLMNHGELNAASSESATRNNNQAVPSISSSSSNNAGGMLVRQQLQAAPKRDSLTAKDDFKPSLDDKIRHLVIVNNNKDTDGALPRLGAHTDAVQSSKQDNQIYQSTSDASNCRTVLMSRGFTNGSTTNSQDHNIPSSSFAGQFVVVDRHHNPPDIGRVSFESTSLCRQIAGSTNLAQNPTGSTDNTTRSEANNPDMGNRHNRRYQINISAMPSPATGRDGDSSSASENANSQLIVDLTTPRVLAKTQTTLLSSNQLNLIHPSSMQDDKRSLNQVGLPQLSSSAQQSHTSSPKNNVTSNSNLSERTAPYYYSDLKSEEQRRALFNIVQQKSLSPPPQLLSRSADQSSTRLGPKSATPYSKQAKLLSDNFINRNQHCDVTQAHRSSTTNITKNIDRLFETSPASDRRKNKMARSMLTLSNADDLSKTPKSRVEEPIANNYGASTTKGSKLPKSKSMEDLNRELVVSTSNNKSSGFSNPVYENIRLSSKLMDAINCSTANQSGATTSEESMDSILGSSLEDSDSNSDIIDDIKLSPTDNHINDISRLIEQLKINHSKLTDEYRSTLVRITKTINTKNKQQLSDSDGKVNNEKIARKLEMLNLKSKKCESRSKNQLALIQMMENVLRQSKMRSGGVHRYQASSSAWPQESISCEKTVDSTSLDERNKNSSAVDQVDSSHSLSFEERLNRACKSSDALASSITQRKLSLKQDTEKEEGKHSPDYTNKDSRADTKDSSGVYSINSLESQRKSDVVLCSVAEKILDIEKRTKVVNPTDENLTVTTNKASAKSLSSANESISPNVNSTGSNANNSLNSITDGFQSSRDDDDFIEFYSSDISGHRSNFEASQFSASDYNTSTSASESSTSGLCTDSLGSSKNTYNPNPSSRLDTKDKNFSQMYQKSRDSKSKSQSVGALHDKNTNSGRHSADVDSIKSGKFSNVLGNVIDVDVCPVNNLS